MNFNSTIATAHTGEERGRGVEVIIKTGVFLEDDSSAKYYTYTSYNCNRRSVVMLLSPSRLLLPARRIAARIRNKRRGRGNTTRAGQKKADNVRSSEK